jgi:tRNA-splicing ligase RtcB
MPGAVPSAVSAHAKARQREEVGTLGSGNHYLEIQCVTEIFDAETAAAFDLELDAALVTIHCGSRGLGHQIGTEFLRSMAIAGHEYGIHLPDRELACAPLESDLGRTYLGAMRAAINCAFANRQVITHLVRRSFERVLPRAKLELVYDVSHNTCKLERHDIDGVTRNLFVHRKGATRAFGPGDPSLPDALRPYGQPVLIGGSMGTASYVLVGASTGEALSFSSACHGAGRAMSRHQAAREWHGEQVIRSLEHAGILIRSRSKRGVAEEAPGAYKDVTAVVQAAHDAGLARKVARLAPLICIKG